MAFGSSTHLFLITPGKTLRKEDSGAGTESNQDDRTSVCEPTGGY